jgi:hypothetical protein
MWEVDAVLYGYLSFGALRYILVLVVLAMSLRCAFWSLRCFVGLLYWSVMLTRLLGRL